MNGKFKILHQYKSMSDNTNIPRSYVTREGEKLGDSISNQRRLHHTNQLSTTRFSMFDSISFDWDSLMRKREKLQRYQ